MISPVAFCTELSHVTGAVLSDGHARSLVILERCALLWSAYVVPAPFGTCVLGPRVRCADCAGCACVHLYAFLLFVAFFLRLSSE